jgi:HrpA-like RNA helicase
MQHKASKDTRLLFCTTGILLRRLTFSATVPDVSHIIIDEVHERSVEIDFLLVILKRVLKSRPDLRVILMSATANADSFCRYFHNAPFMHIPGRTFPVQEFYLEDVIERSGYVPNGHNYRPGGRSRTFANDTIAQLALTGNYCDRTLKALNFIEEGVPDAELVTATLWYIIENLPPAAILVCHVLITFVSLKCSI